MREVISIHVYVLPRLGISAEFAMVKEEAVSAFLLNEARVPPSLRQLG